MRLPYERCSVRDAAHCLEKSQSHDTSRQRQSGIDQSPPPVEVGAKANRIEDPRVTGTESMQYSVKALPIMGEMARFWKLLNDGTIGRQEPDGREIVASMKRAIMTKDRVEWQETCYCSPPLNHERSTVYDQFFKGIEIAPIASPSRLEGQRFWDYLSNYTNGQERTVDKARIAGPVRYVPIRIL